MTIEETFRDYHARITAGGIAAQPSDYFKAGYIFGAAAEVDKQKEGRVMLAAAPTPPEAIKPDPEHLVALALNGSLPKEQTKEVLTQAGIIKTTAPELEPVAWTGKGCGVISGKARARMIEDENLGGEFAIAARTAKSHDIPLYAHPANDGLRNAAEEVARYFDDQEAAAPLAVLIYQLRAELDKGKSC